MPSAADDRSAVLPYPQNPHRLATTAFKPSLSRQLSLVLELR